MKTRPRAIVIRHYLTPDEKKKLRKEAKERGFRGLRELLKYRGTSDLMDDPPSQS